MMEILEINSTKKYSIYIGRNILIDCVYINRDLFCGRKVCIVTDSNVYAIYGDMIKSAFSNISVIPDIYINFPGETGKTIEHLQSILKYLIDKNYDRTSMLVAFGGGVIGDITAFAASVYMRGIQFVNIPTTIIAQCDSSIGGKTAVDFCGKKNMVGTFYDPQAVICDPLLLRTLNDHFIKDGLGEIIKYAILDKSMFSLVDSMCGPADFFTGDILFVKKSLQIKKRYIEEDMIDKGPRKLLNLGHTVGHAIEAAMASENYSHGVCVAIGIAIITKYGIRYLHSDEELYNITVDIMRRFDMPTNMEGIMGDLVYNILSDKKRSGENIDLAIPMNIGDVKIYKTRIESFIDDIKTL